MTLTITPASISGHGQMGNCSRTRGSCHGTGSCVWQGSVMCHIYGT